MTYPIKYLISFLFSLFIFSLSVFFSNAMSGEFPVSNPWLWFFQKSSIEILLNFFTMQISAVIFTFAFWTKSIEVRKWKKAPFKFVFSLFILFFLMSAFLYSLKEYFLTDVSRQFYALEENGRTIASFKGELLELKAQKGYLEERLAVVPQGLQSQEKLQLAYYDVLSRIMHIYCQYASIEDSADMQENIRVARTAVELNRVETGGKPTVVIPFNNLTGEELVFLYESFEKQKDYMTALYLVRLLQERDLEDTFYQREDKRLREILDNPKEDTQVQTIRSSFTEKKRYYLAFQAGRKLEAFYGIQDFLRRFPDDKDGKELFKRLEQTIEQEFVFDQDIMDSFEMGGPRATFLLNDNTDSYREYVYLGKIIGFKNHIVVRDVVILRLHPDRGLSLCMSAPYASFERSTNSLIFDVIDAHVSNPYLELTVKYGSLEFVPKEWKINYPLETLSAFSLVRFANFSDLSFSQVWTASYAAKEIGNIDQGSVFFYEVFKRVLAPILFIFVSLWLVGLSLRYPVVGKECVWGMVILASASFTIGAFLEFLFYDLVALATFFFVNNIFGMIMVFTLIFILLGWVLLNIVEIIRRQNV